MVGQREGVQKLFDLVMSRIETKARVEEGCVQGDVRKREFRGYEMVYYRVTRWGTKLWCLLTSYIEKYKVWQSKGKAKAKQGEAGHVAS